MAALAPAELPSVWLTTDEVEVEAGSFAELRVGVELPPNAGANDDGEYRLEVVGVPPDWFTLSSTSLLGTIVDGAKALLVFHPPGGHQLTAAGEHAFFVRVQSTVGGWSVQRRGRLTVLPPGSSSPNRLLDFLPPMYEEDFTLRFLSIFQSFLAPAEEVVDTTELYLDPDLAPAPMLPWLAQWVGLSLTSTETESQRRVLVRQAVHLAKWRGTRQGLQDELRLRLGLSLIHI